jgi:hypothetical protein
MLREIIEAVLSRDLIVFIVKVIILIELSDISVIKHRHSRSAD